MYAAPFYSSKERRAKILVKVLGGIEFQLKKRTLDVDAVRRYIDNFNRFPEVRKFGSEMLARATNVVNPTPRRALLCNHLSSLVIEWENKQYA